MVRTLTLIACLACARSAFGAYLYDVYFNDFDDTKITAPGVTDSLSGPRTPRSVQGWNGLGTGSNTFSGFFIGNDSTGNPALATQLTLSNLPEHESIDVKFLLALVDSWDGSEGNGSQDYLLVSVDGVTILRATFTNIVDRTQTYVPPPGVLLSFGEQLGYIGGDFKDSAYNMGLDPRFLSIPHTASSVTIKWQAFGNGWQGGSDEWFALENLNVAVTIVPEASTSMMLIGVLFFGLTRVAWRKGFRQSARFADHTRNL